MYSQEVQWADSVIEFSSAYKKNQLEYQFQPVQALGVPNVVPGGRSSPCSWSPSMPSNPLGESIYVSFSTPIHTRQIIISQPLNGGAIFQIELFDRNGKAHEVFRQKFNVLPFSKDQVWNLILDKTTKFKVHGLKLKMATHIVDGWNHIDGIGITESQDPLHDFIQLPRNYPGSPTALKFINTPENEIAPFPYPQKNHLYFSRDIKNENAQIFIASKKDGRWKKSNALQGALNDSRDNFISGIFPGENLICLGQQYHSESKQSGISFWVKKNEKFTFQSNSNFRFFNQSQYVDYFLSHSGNILIFSGKTEFSYGDRDLYVCFRRNDSLWSKPKNLGPVINSAHTELSPFLAPDEQTLYFSSEGHAGYGQADIFMTRRKDGTWTNWTKPVNLGPQVNNHLWNAYFKTDSEGNKGYFATPNKQGENFDLFKVNLSSDTKPSTPWKIYLKVQDSLTGQNLSSKIHHSSGITSGKTILDSAQEQVLLLLPPYGKGTTISFHSDGYKNKMVKLNRPFSNTSKKSVTLVPENFKKRFVLQDIRFKRGTPKLIETYTPTIKRLVNYLKKNPDARIKLEGHTDYEGDAEKNLKLSKKRVEVIKGLLQEEGIAPERIELAWFGEQEPLVKSDNVFKREKNRRVEVIFLNRN